MYVQIKNENYGYAVATYGDYVVVGNPDFFRFDPLTSSIYHTGSVDYFRYNKTTDQHDYIGTIYKPWIDINVLLTTELSGSVLPTASLTTELSGSVLPTASIIIDKNNYTGSLEDEFGVSLDMYNKFLVAGAPYFTEFVQTYTASYTASGALVGVFDLGLTEVPASSSSPLIYTILDPDSGSAAGSTGSFGKSVSINSQWIAIGSPYISSSKGMVYMYLNQSTGSNYTWSLYQKIEISDAIPSASFGYSLKLNKCTGSRSSSLVIGCGNDSGSKAYYFEFTNSLWDRTFVFNPSYDPNPMLFGNYNPYQLTMSSYNGFGKAVSTYGDVVIVGEYLDRTFYEYSGSSLYPEGSVYVFERCLNQPYTLFQQVLKTYGNANTLRKNRAGFSVDIFGYNAVAGIPKIDVLSMGSCYVGGTIQQLHYCDFNLQDLLLGQAMLLQKNTSSNQWEITNIYQKKKKYMSPFRSYGFDVAIANRSMVVGAPIYLSDPNRQINISTTRSKDIDLDDIAGKSYIYNLANLHNTFHVGNVFYRNGKIIIMTSGSMFDGLFFNSINEHTYEYDLQFKSQHTIFEKQIICSVNPGEFNVSTNPTSISKSISSLDINGNGVFDFQDLDVVLRYMQYKNTDLLGLTSSTDWSSSILKSDDEISLYNYYQTTGNYVNTSLLASESIVRFETADTSIQTSLDLNGDNKIDFRDMNIMWKYFSNRLTQANYATFITPACRRKLLSDIIDYMNYLSQKNAIPYINSQFSNYESNVVLDKTGSFLDPYCTSIGLYSGLDLVAVAKLGTPIKITPELPINIVIKMDF